MSTEAVSRAGKGAPASNVHLELPSVIQDGLFIHSAILARGLDALVLPRQVLLSGVAGEEPGEVSFVHGIPQASTLAGVTYAQDKRIRRNLQARADLSIPEGATFSYRGLSDARLYAERLGYPLVLKEAVGENPTEQITGITDADRFNSAVRELRMLPGKRSAAASSLTRSAYALTGLLDMEEDEDGNKLAAAATRFLVEREVRGTYMRFLLLGEEVVGMLHFPEGTRRAGASGDGAELTPRRLELAVETRRWKFLGKVRWEGGVHPGFVTIARRAMQAVPGLRLGYVDIVATDMSLAPEEQSHWVVELSERPRLEVFSRAEAGWGEQLADRIVVFEAGRVGVPLGEIRDRVTLQLRAESVPDVKTFVPLLVTAARQLRLRGHASIDDPVEGTLDALVEGPPAAVATLAEAIMGGGLGGMRAIVLTERHTAVSVPADFKQV